MSAASTCNVRVVCRFRPVNEREKREGGWRKLFFFSFSELAPPGDANDLSFPSAQSVRVKGLDFTLDRVFENAQQDDVFSQVRLSIEDVLNGFNSTIFAYGQTGSGKVCGRASVSVCLCLFDQRFTVLYHVWRRAQRETARNHPEGLPPHFLAHCRGRQWDRMADQGKPCCWFCVFPLWTLTWQLVLFS